MTAVLLLELGQTEVGDGDLVALAEHDVVRCEIAMHNVLLFVQISKSSIRSHLFIGLKR